MAKIWRLNRNIEGTVEEKKTAEQSDVFRDFMIMRQKQSINLINTEEF